MRSNRRAPVQKKPAPTASRRAPAEAAAPAYADEVKAVMTEVKAAAAAAAPALAEPPSEPATDLTA
jgi:hypothetical protein